MTKGRSPNYPVITLEDAITKARKLYEKEKWSSIPLEVAVQAWGYKGVNGSSRRHLSALKQYGLLELSADTVRLTQLCKAIQLAPEGSTDKADAVKTAALTPPVFLEIYEKHSDKSDESLKYHLTMKESFTEDAAERVVSTYRANMLLLGQEDNSDNELTGDHLSEEAVDRKDEREPHDDEKGIEDISIENYNSNKDNNRSRSFSWPLSKGVIAKVIFVGSELEADQIDILKQYLDIVKIAISSEME